MFLSSQKGLPLNLVAQLSQDIPEHRYLMIGQFQHWYASLIPPIQCWPSMWTLELPAFHKEVKHSTLPPKGGLPSND